MAAAAEGHLLLAEHSRPRVGLTAAGRKVAGDPKIFRVRGGDLFLFASSASRDAWLRAEADRIRAANANWDGRDPSVQGAARATSHWNAPNSFWV